MGGLGFIHPGFLAAGAAFVAVPLVLHLLFRRKAPRVDIGSIRFLKVAIKDNAHRRKVRRWLLLAARVAAALLLGALFARPVRPVPEVPGEEREVVVLLDRSASMGAGGPAGPAFPRAKAAIKALLAGEPAGTAVHLALFDDSGVTPVPAADLGRATTTNGRAGTDFARGLAWARDRVVASRRKARRVHLFTDLQRSGLGRPAPEPFPDGVAVEVIDVGRTLAGNLAVDDVRPLRTEVRPGEGPELAARVFNAGSFAAREAQVRLVLEGPGGRVEQARTIAVEGGSRREVRFVPPIAKPGLYRGYVEVIGGDDLPFDDRRWVAFEARRPETILLVDGDPGSTVYGDETYYLEATLRLRVPGSGPSATPFEARRVDGDAWPDLAGTRVVVLANVEAVPRDAAGRLRTFVAAGGGLIVFGGDRVAAGAYGSLRDAGLLPAEVAGMADGPFRLDRWEPDHPLLRPFADPQHGDLRTLAFSRALRLNPATGSVVLASTSGGLPLLVESTVGKGRVLQLALAADKDWGDWSIHRLYLPLVHQIMGYLTDRLPGAGRVRPGPVTHEAGPGIEAVGDALLVRNTDPAESEIDRATPAEFRAALRLPTADSRSGKPEPPPLPPLEGSERPDEAWRLVAWALLVLLVAETFLANRTPA